MLEIVGRMSPELTEQMRSHLDTLKSHLTPDVSNYAKGRQRFWLEHEAPLSANRPWMRGVHDERLWSWISKTLPQVELGLAAYGEVGIDFHRDASYADFVGYSINLGDVEGWEYDPIYPGYEWTKNTNPSAPVRYDLVPGTIIKFNVKNPHRVVGPAADRWSLNLWSVSKKERPRFESYLKGESQLSADLFEGIS